MEALGALLVWLALWVMVAKLSKDDWENMR